MPSRFATLSSLGLTSVLVLLAGCSVGPDYVKPTVPEPTSYKEAGKWKKAEPSDNIAKGNWYTVFHDKQLNDLEARAVASNQNLRAAIARVSTARAIARETEAGFFPTLNGGISGARQTTSPYDGAAVAQSGGTVPRTFYTSATVPFDLSYEVDIWGKVRRAFEQAGDKAQASLADFENILLGLKADVATTYFALRTDDAEIDVQRRTIKEYQSALDLTNSRFKGGISTELDVQQALATLASAQAQLASLNASRAKLEHALAVLLGIPPEGFSVPYNPLNNSYTPPAIPPGLPSQMLERRPDVASAERKVAAQNAAIGVAIAAYFPTINLTGQTGFDSGDLGMLFNWQSRIWSYGPNIQFPIFEGGQISANVKQQRATYEENVALYREQVLVAFQDVDDSLSSLRYLSQQQDAQDRAYAAYNKALQLTNDRYTTGLVSYFDVIQAENLALAAEQLTVQIRGDRVATTIQLIKALGGGWADSYVTQVHMGDQVNQPNVPPTVLTPQKAVPPLPAHTSGH